MHCGQCGKTVAEESVYCNFCGKSLTETPIQSNRPTVSHTFTYSPGRSRKTLGIISSIVGLILLVGVAYFVVIPNQKYSHAKSLLHDAHYEEAIRSFSNLDGFRDSEQLIMEAKYSLAKQAISQKDYGKGIELFEQIAGYKDAETLLSESSYIEGEKQFKAGNYDQAKRFLANSPDYLSTSSYLATIAITETFEGKWEDDSLFQQLYFHDDIVTKVFFPNDPIDNAVYSWALTMKDNALFEPDLTIKYYIKGDRLFEESKGEVTSFRRIGDAVDIPEDTPVK